MVMRVSIRSVMVAALIGAMCPTAARAQAPAEDPLALVRDGRKLNAAGQFDEALALYKRALDLDAASFDAHLASGITLDLKGDYARARTHLQRAIDLAPEGQKAQALSQMAVSYAFEQRAAEAATYYQQQFDLQLAAGLLDAAAATANALGRVHLESGNPAEAARWYERGYDTARKLPNLPPDQVDLWALRWEHAQSRTAARRGDPDGAARHAAAVKAIVDKGGLNEEQRPAYHYLAGYVAFYAGQPDAAVAALLQADQRDPFILGLIAQAYEKQGNVTKAKEYYERVLRSTSHNLQNAFSRPLARRKMTELK
jgi:tetratricopeptide (TPR) repeat protein